METIDVFFVFVFYVSKNITYYKFYFKIIFKIVSNDLNNKERHIHDLENILENRDRLNNFFFRSWVVMSRNITLNFEFSALIAVSQHRTS